MNANKSDDATAVAARAPRRGRQGRRVGVDVMRRGVAAVAVALLAWGLSACGDTEPIPPMGTDTTPAPAGVTPDESVSTGAAGTPAVTVTYGSTQLELLAFTACYDTSCVDGMPPKTPLHIGSPPEVEISFPLPDWSFTAAFEPVGDSCGREQTVPVQRTGEQTFVLRPAGHADTYDVMLFGKGNGDLFTMFRWSTPTDGPLPKPEATLAVLADNDGQIDSYGVELMLSNLAATPRKATATITVTAANGEHLTFTATRSPDARRGCLPVGTIYWDGPDERGTHAASLGPRPVTYDVVLTLDGTRHHATARWPADVIPGNEPSVALTFLPPLPAPR